MVHTSYDNQVYGVAALINPPFLSDGQKATHSAFTSFVKLVFFVFNLNGSVVCV